MAVVSENGATVITPTASKWYTGAGIVAALGFATGAYAVVLVAVALALIGGGQFNRIALDANGFEYRNFLTRKRYAWHEVSDFGLREYRANFFVSTKLITFTERARRDSLYGKFARAVAGGTQSVPVLGMQASELLALFQTYHARAVPMADLEKILDAAPNLARQQPRPVAQPKPAVPRTAPKPAPAYKPVDLVVNGRARARQTKGWPYA